jgi:hypothetical protein
MTDSHEDQEPREPSEIDEAAQASDALRRAIEKLSRDIGGEMVDIRKGGKRPSSKDWANAYVALQQVHGCTAI